MRSVHQVRARGFERSLLDDQGFIYLRKGSIIIGHIDAFS